MNRAPANENLIQRTRQFWHSRLGRDVSSETARQIAENVTGFFAVLSEWSHAERRASNDNKAPWKADGHGPCHDR
jgi:hypothetical protein